MIFSNSENWNIRVIGVCIAIFALQDLHASI